MMPRPAWRACQFWQPVPGRNPRAASTTTREIHCLYVQNGAYEKTCMEKINARQDRRIVLTSRALFRDQLPMIVDENEVREGATDIHTNANTFHRHHRLPLSRRNPYRPRAELGEM